jgi:hypothetical protein
VTGAYLQYNNGSVTGVGLNFSSDYAYSDRQFIYKLEAKKVDLWFLSFQQPDAGWEYDGNASSAAQQGYYGGSGSYDPYSGQSVYHVPGSSMTLIGL